MNDITPEEVSAFETRVMSIGHGVLSDSEWRRLIDTLENAWWDRDAAHEQMAWVNTRLRDAEAERDAMRVVVDAGRSLEEVHRCESLSVDGEPGGCLCRWCELRRSIEFVDALRAAQQEPTDD